MLYIFLYTVSDLPVLKLMYGEMLEKENATHHRQGDGILFACQVTAKPKVASIEWYQGVR